MSNDDERFDQLEQKVDAVQRDVKGIKIELTRKVGREEFLPIAHRVTKLEQKVR